MYETIDTPFFTSTPARPPFDPELTPTLEALREVFTGLTEETLPLERQVMTEGIPGVEPVDLSAGGAVRVEELQVPGPEGAPDITLLILSPQEKDGLLPGIFHTHGGGMVMGDRRLGVDMFLPYVASGSAVVVSVEYRLAPEHPAPAAVQDCYAGLTWTARKARELGIDSERIMIAGASAGGGLAAGTALLARDRGFPKLSHQILICPMLDDRFLTHSSRMLDGEGLVPRGDVLFSWNALLGARRGGPDVTPYTAPARAQDLTGLPRTYIDAGSVEGVRDEVLAYARRLSEAGISVDLHMWGGGFHQFDVVAPHTALSRASLATRDEFMRRALRG